MKQLCSTQSKNCVNNCASPCETGVLYARREGTEERMKEKRNVGQVALGQSATTILLSLMFL